MSLPFPFGLLFPTAFYLTMYVLTFVLHQAFMHYVLAGCLYLTWATIRDRDSASPNTNGPLGATLRDWIPFLLSAAITAGVAPLLFIQICYQYQFYTANLLLWWRWMVVIPVLIVGFYLTYLVKSHWLWQRPYPFRVSILLSASVCFLFVGFCWTANHLIANRGSTWPEVYVTGRLPFTVVEISLRMLVWVGGSFATLAAIVAWQLRHQQARWDSASTGQPLAIPVRRLAAMSLGGLSVALIGGLLYVTQIDQSARELLFGRLGVLYLVTAFLGIGLQVAGWVPAWRSNDLKKSSLIMASAGALVTLLSVAVLRETIRISAIDLTSLAQKHADAAKIGGFEIFLVATVVVGFLIAWCLHLVRSAVQSTTKPSNDVSA